MARRYLTNVELMAELEVLQTKFSIHENHCETAHKEVQFQIRRLERIVIVTGGTIILFLAGILFAILFP
jgi:hypothetical protein